MKTIDKTIKGTKTFLITSLVSIALAVFTVFIPYLAALTAGATIVAALAGVMVLNEARDLWEEKFWQASVITKRIQSESSKVDFDEDLIKAKSEPKSVRQQVEEYMNELNKDYAPHE